jgi:hypothetical protein
MQASNREVVASLAEFGIDVTEGLVRQVKVEMLQEASKVERHKVAAQDRFQRRRIGFRRRYRHRGRGTEPSSFARSTRL